MAFPATPVISRSITNKPSTLPVSIPPGDTTVTVKLINPVHFGPSDIRRFMTPDVPGFDKIDKVPSNCFLLQHPSGRNVVWDLGVRSDYHNYAPSIANYLPTTGYSFEHHGDVIDQLQRGGINPEDVEAIIWSHWHWDHIGDPSRFPVSTDLVVGQDFKKYLTPGAPVNPDSPLLEADWK
jgi:glyoxylase-like metal-dependent hydrolase (beta-lactamase superfamily II)